MAEYLNRELESGRITQEQYNKAMADSIAIIAELNENTGLYSVQEELTEINYEVERANKA